MPSVKKLQNSPILTLFFLLMGSAPFSLAFEGTHDSSADGLNLHPMNPWVVSSESVTPHYRPEHPLRKHEHIMGNFRNFDQESPRLPPTQNRYLDSGGGPPQEPEVPVFPTPLQNNMPAKKYEEMFDIDFPPYPPRGVADLFGGKPIRDTARCFSCMSKFYEAVWPALSSVYKRPRNFTDRCNDDIIDPKYVPVTQCGTICVQMWEEPTVAGVKIRGHIRGCLDDLLHNGFNQTIVTWYRWMHRDSCRQYRKRELFKLPVDQSDDSLIHVCTCYADYCNTTPARTSTCSALKLLHSISVLLVLLFWRI